MFYKNHRLQSFLTVFLLLAFLTSGLMAQGDIVTSSDISAGSSVFVFRASSKARQKKVAYRSSSRQKRSVAQRRKTRSKIVRQSNTVARANQKRRPTKRVDPATLARITPQIKTMPKEEASLIFAGAGEYYLERDDLKQAIDFFKESISLDDTNKFGKTGLSDAYARKGNELLEKEEIKEAKFYFEEAVRLDAENATAYVGLGEIYDTLEQDKEAIENYEKALSLNSELTELYVPLGIMLYQQGEIAKSETYLEKSLKIDPDNAQTQYFLGLIRYKQNRLDEARKALSRSIELEAENADAHYYLGEVYDKQGKDKEAIAEYETATRINPKYVDAWFDLGAARYNMEDYDAAIEAYQKVIALKNDYWEAHANLGDAYRQKNQFGKAEGSYRIATARIKNDADLYSKFGFVLGRQGKWKPTIEQLDNAIRIDPKGFDYANLGWAYYNSAQEKMGLRQKAEAEADLAKGRAALEKAVQMDDKSAAAYLNLGITLIDLGDYKAAADALESAVKLRGDWVPALNELGIAYRKQNKFDEAIKHFRKAVDVDEKFAAGYFNLGEALYRNRKTGDAKKIVDKLKPLNPGLARRLEVMIAMPVSR